MLSGKAPFVGNCGEDCEWEKGGSCYECQRTLWNSIKEGKFVFDDRGWNHISREAKDLVKNLLVKDASKRLTAKEVLRHPWISMVRTLISAILKGSDNPLDEEILSVTLIVGRTSC